jgi:hypothetical protein
LQQRVIKSDIEAKALKERGSHPLRHIGKHIEDRGKIGRETNFQVWKVRVLLILEENDLKQYVEVVVASPIDM